MRDRHVVIVGYDGLQTLDAAGPFEVFAGASTVTAARGGTGYRVELVSSAGGVLRAESGMGLCSGPLPRRDRTVDTLVLAGGSGVGAARQDTALVSWIRAVAPRCRRVATVCSGALLAAECGLLDGRRATTHWSRAGQLAEEFPAVAVDPDPIYIRDGRVWTSAGVTAGIDLRWWRTTSGPMWPGRWHGGWSCSSTGPGVRPSSPRRCGSRGPTARRCVRHRSGWRPRPGRTTACPPWPRGPP